MTSQPVKIISYTRDEQPQKHHWQYAEPRWFPQGCQERKTVSPIQEVYLWVISIFQNSEWTQQMVLQPDLCSHLLHTQNKKQDSGLKAQLFKSCIHKCKWMHLGKYIWMVLQCIPLYPYSQIWALWTFFISLSLSTP